MMILQHTRLTSLHSIIKCQIPYTIHATLATSHSASGCCKTAFSIPEHTHHSLHRDEWLLMSTEEYSELLL